jgi:hypothetical protein
MMDRLIAGKNPVHHANPANPVHVTGRAKYKQLFFMADLSATVFTLKKPNGHKNTENCSGGIKHENNKLYTCTQQQSCKNNDESLP